MTTTTHASLDTTGPDSKVGLVDAEVRRVCSAVLGVDIPAGEPVPRKQIESWDSLLHVELIFAVEEETGVELDAEALGLIDSVASLVAAVLAAS